jgi:hypothetical protein
MADSSDRPDDSAQRWTLSDLPWRLASHFVEDAGHWRWTAAKDRDGYGQYGYRMPGDIHRRHRVHRLVFQLLVGPIPHGYVIDHLCHVRACAYPAHLEAVTINENSRRSSSNQRQDYCVKGHPLMDANLYVQPSTGQRSCRECRLERTALSRLRGLRRQPRPGRGQRGLWD